MSTRSRKEHLDITAALADAEAKAIDNLARYKFHNFGYWAAWWVKLNQLSGERRPNPFARLVLAAREVRDLRALAAAARDHGAVHRLEDLELRGLVDLDAPEDRIDPPEQEGGDHDRKSEVVK